MMEACLSDKMLFFPSFSSTLGQRADFWSKPVITPFFPPISIVARNGKQASKTSTLQLVLIAFDGLFAM
jgi:hypothetical protein